MTSAAELSRLHLGWYYNWKPVSKIPPASGVEFVPMFWSALDVTSENLAAVNQSAATHVLGFNEPDMTGQANMIPEECLELWPQLMTLKQRLGSPAPADSTWMEMFMPEAKRRGLRVDFVCLHRYPDISDPDAADKIEVMLTEAHRKYGLPVWLTECGAADVSAWHQPQLNKPTPEMAESFLKKLLAMLERLPFVERYAWFADRVGDEYGLGSIFDPHARRLTPFGKIYRDADRMSTGRARTRKRGVAPASS
ncbi:MAG: glycosyl hydrolase [Verrucomicrobiae bacterium]